MAVCTMCGPGQLLGRRQADPRSEVVVRAAPLALDRLVVVVDVARRAARVGDDDDGSALLESLHDRVERVDACNTHGAQTQQTSAPRGRCRVWECTMRDPS